MNTGPKYLTTKPIRYKCSRGHGWESAIYNSRSITIDLDGKHPTAFCLTCIYDLCQNYIGVVDVVEEKDEA